MNYFEHCAQTFANVQSQIDKNSISLAFDLKRFEEDICSEVSDRLVDYVNFVG